MLSAAAVRPDVSTTKGVSFIVFSLFELMLRRYVGTERSRIGQKHEPA
jgi:hypothetical protein